MNAIYKAEKRVEASKQRLARCEEALEELKAQQAERRPATIVVRLGDKIIEAYNEDDLYNQIEQMNIWGGR